MTRIQSLDGLRALSILLVLLGHSVATMPAAVADHPLTTFLANPALGVKIFFVLSGYLITKLLIREREQNGYIDIRHFYIRRAFRILPVFYLYIIAILAIKLLYKPDIFVDATRLWLAITYLTNYQHLFTLLPDPNGTWFFAHFWSLSMEEQFYVVWPLIFIKTPKEKIRSLVVAIIVVMPLIRSASYWLIPGSRGMESVMLHTGGDTILTGCLGALLEKEAAFKARYKSYIQNKWIILGVVVYVFGIDRYLPRVLGTRYDFLLGRSLCNTGIMIFIFWAIYVPSWCTRILNHKKVVMLGVLSYSIYIWQQLFVTPLLNTWMNLFPINLIVSCIVGGISYYYIEKPVMQLKSRFQRKREARPLTVPG